MCFAPFKVRDAGNLLTRAGFTLPGVDVDQYTVKYNSGLYKKKT
jgi:NADH dehydrogenase [ubiquinone] 1 alpha subcomplex assembly factor 5